MKMSLYLVLVLLGNISFAQSVTISHVSVPVEYYRMPDEDVDPSYSTYSAEVTIRHSELLRTSLTVSSLENEYLSLEGYRKVFSNADLHIEAHIGEFTIYDERRGTHTTKSKDKDGKEIVRTHYFIELRYFLPISYEVSERDGRNLEDEYIYHLSDDQSWQSSNYSSLADLDRYWRSNRTLKLAELQKNRIRQGMKEIHERINNKFGYRLINENERFEKIGRKKHPEYSKYNAAAETVKKAFKLMDADKGLENVSIAVQPAIDFYKTADANCKANDKDGTRLKHIGLYNLGLIYFWLEDFEQAENYAVSIQHIDEKDKDAKRLLEEIDYVKSSLTRANRKSRHQAVNKT